MEAMLLISEYEVILREEEEAKRAAEACAIREMKATDAEINEIFDQVETIVADVLAACGLHQHKGEWRKKRNTMANQTAVEGFQKHHQAIEILEKVNCEKPTKAAIKNFQTLLQEDRERIRQVGDVMAHAETFLLRAANPSFLVQETVGTKLTDLRRELVSKKPAQKSAY